MRNLTRIVAPGLVSIIVLGGCTNSDVNPAWTRSRAIGEGDRPTGISGATEQEPHSSATSSPIVDPRSVPIFDGRSSSALSWDELVGRAAESDIVLVGEAHGQGTTQALLPLLFEDIASRAPSAWLSMEFFERDQQTALDDFLAGVTNEEEFKTASHRTMENYPSGHRALVGVAKRLGRPVVASNAPRRYVRLSRTAGYARLQSLSPEQQELFVVPESLTEGRYRTEFESQMREMIEKGQKQEAEAKEKADAAQQGDTTPEPQDIESKVLGYYRAQNLWDATMADSVTRPAMAGGRPVFHVVGQFHTDKDGGLTQRVRALGPSLRVMTISLVDEPASPSAGMRAEDAGRADVVVYVGR